MKKSILFLIFVFSLFVSCNKNEGETVESAYLLPLIPEPKYSFSRNGTSSVDYNELFLLEETFDALYRSYMKKAEMNGTNYPNALSYYENGFQFNGYGLKPLLASSVRHSQNKTDVEADFNQIFQAIAKISGNDSDSPITIRRREAKQGRTGFVGIDWRDPNVVFVDERGVEMSEVFHKSVLGAIFLDKILNHHLDEQFFENPMLIKNHEDTQLLLGRNYTELEHHWDLAYGYYNLFLKSWVQADGIPPLKNSETELIFAFVQGRFELGRFRYEAMREHLRTIRRELSKVFAVRAMSLLVGENTLANVDEDISLAFESLSQAYGFIYSLQFAKNSEGENYFTREQIQNLLGQLMQTRGFWDRNRLASDVQVQGSLERTAFEVGKPFGISINDVKR